MITRLLTALAVTAAVTTPALARTAPVEATVAAPRTADASDVYATLQRVVRDVCKSELRRTGTVYGRALRTCERATLNRAVADLNRPQVTALHNGAEAPTRVLAQR